MTNSHPVQRSKIIENTIELTLTNLSDDAAFRHGYISAEKVRTVRVTAMIDAHRRKLCVPAEIAAMLGFGVDDKWNVDVSDGKHTTCTTACLESNSNSVIAGTMVTDGLRDVLPFVGLRLVE